jgi:glucosamine--fructose-6-phosphate aminotransferase (isomerizing)
MGRLDAADADRMSQQIETLRDIAWCLRAEILGNIAKVRELVTGGEGGDSASPPVLQVFRNLNAVLNSIDRMEVRGRDSAGVSLLFVLAVADYERFIAALGRSGLQAMTRRGETEPLLNWSIRVHRGTESVAVAFTYKVAVEIGSLGTTSGSCAARSPPTRSCTPSPDSRRSSTRSTLTPAGRRWAPSPRRTAIRWTTG